MPGGGCGHRCGQAAGMYWSGGRAGPGGRLGVDDGSAATVGVLGWLWGGWRVLSFEGVAELPGAVCGADGGVVTGVAALWRGVADPGGFEAEPGRRLLEDGSGSGRGG